MRFLLSLLYTFLFAGSSWAEDAERGAAKTSTAPVVRFLRPAHREHLRGVIPIQVEVEHPRSIHQVQVYQGDTLIGAAFAPPFEVAWNTTAEPEGPHALVAKAIDAEFHEGAARITVTVDNSPPAVSWIAPREGSLAVGTVRLEVAASDLIGIRSVRFLVNGKVAGETANLPYVFDWESTTLPNRPCVLEARAFDRAGNSTTSPPVTVKVANFNRHPVLDPIGPKRVEETATLVFTVQGHDPDGARDPLTFQATHLPPWAVFNPATREFRGTPPSSEASAKEPQKEHAGIRFEVCDPEPLCDREEITITVAQHNTAPALEPPGDRTVEEEKPFSLTLVASDPEDDPLTCRATRLPEWATFDASTCTVAGTPGPDVATPADPTTVYAEVGFEVCDPEQLCAKRTMNLTVVNVQDRPPAFEPLGDGKIDEGKLLSVTVRAQDPDGKTPELSAGSLPDGGTFTDNANGTGEFTWTPRFDQAGTYEVMFLATDGTFSANARMPVVVRETRQAISGVIRDTSTEAPLLGATVEISTVTGKVKEVTTDTRGRYLAVGLGRATYQLTPRYRIERPFSTAGGALTGVTFSPPSQRVTLSDRDVTGVDFKATPP